MKYALTLFIFSLTVTYFDRAAAFRFHSGRNLVYNSNNRMKRSFDYSPEDETVLDLVDENPYRIVKGYRVVVPYINLYKTYVKKRWMGKQLHKVLTDEFAAFSDDYIKYASSKNRIKVFDKDNKDLYAEREGDVLEHVLRPNERIFHYASVHEPLSLHTQIRVLEDSDEYIFVSKPNSIPVYCTGTYRYNTLVEIMKHELDCCKNTLLYPVHRIDKLVSGVVALAKSGKAATILSQFIKDRLIKKVYIARVCGNFADFVKKTDQCIIDEGLEDPVLNKIVEHKGYIHPVCIKLSQQEFTEECLDDTYKQAVTRFRFIAYNEALNESLILVSPVTGRTHQIRAHLKYLGYAISNDPCYNNGVCVDSSEYFKGIPTVSWQIDEAGNWCIPEIGLFEDSSNKPDHDHSIYHIGLNNKDDTKLTKSGIFLHALRFIWRDHFDVSDDLPGWIDKFDLDPDLNVSELTLW